MIWGIASILLWVATIIFYIIRNLLVKTEKLERLVEERDIYINNLDAVIEDITKRLQEVVVFFCSKFILVSGSID